MEYLLHFGFTSDRLSPMELRDLVRWTVKPQILAVPGSRRRRFSAAIPGNGRC